MKVQERLRVGASVDGAVDGLLEVASDDRSAVAAHEDERARVVLRDDGHGRLLAAEERLLGLLLDADGIVRLELGGERGALRSGADELAGELSTSARRRTRSLRSPTCSAKSKTGAGVAPRNLTVSVTLSVTVKAKRRTALV